MREGRPRHRHRFRSSEAVAGGCEGGDGQSRLALAGFSPVTSHPRRPGSHETINSWLDMPSNPETGSSTMSSHHPTATYRMGTRPLRSLLKPPSLCPLRHTIATAPPQPRSETRRQTCHLTDGESRTQQTSRTTQTDTQGSDTKRGHAGGISGTIGLLCVRLELETVPRPAARKRTGGEAIPRRFGCGGRP